MFLYLNYLLIFLFKNKKKQRTQIMSPLQFPFYSTQAGRIPTQKILHSDLLHKPLSRVVGQGTHMHLLGPQ